MTTINLGSISNLSKQSLALDKLLGVTQNITYDFYENGSLAIFGEVGSGREVLINNIVLQLLYQHKHVICFDSKKILFNNLRYIPKTDIINEYNQIDAIIEILYEKSHNRLNMLYNINNENINMSNYTFNTYNNDYNYQLNEIYLCLNEFDVSYNSELIKKLEFINQNSTKTGIFIIVCSSNILNNLSYISTINSHILMRYDLSKFITMLTRDNESLFLYEQDHFSTMRNVIKKFKHCQALLVNNYKNTTSDIFKVPFISDDESSELLQQLIN